MQAFPCTISPFPSSSSSSSLSSSCCAAAAASPAGLSAASSARPAEAAGKLPPSAAAAGAAGATTPAAVKPFDRELFRAFISAASRLFCDDEQIVVIDFLAHHEKAFTERELSDRLHWGERRVREACAALERLMLVAKEHLLPSGGAAPRKVDSYSDNGGFFGLQQQEAYSGGGGGGQQQPGASAPSYYRVSPFCFLVFHYRLQRMEQHVETQRRNAESRDVFFCPACRTQYDALEAQLLDVHPQDAHFLCKFCNERLEHEIPTFPPFTRAEKNQQKLKSSEEEEKNKKGALTLHGGKLNGHREDGGLGGWGQLVKNTKVAGAARQGEASGPVQQQSSVGSAVGAATSAPGGRNQIKFAVKNKGVGGKPASVLGSRLRAAQAMQQHNAAAASSSPSKSVGSNAAAAAARLPADAAGSSATAAVGASATAAAGTGRRESGDSSMTSPAQSVVDAAGTDKGAPTAVALQQTAPQQQENKPLEREQQQLDAGPPDAAAAALLHREDLSGTAAAHIDEGAPLLYVSRMGMEMSLEEAAEYQQEMTPEEHEKFMELQAMYLDEI